MASLNELKSELESALLALDRVAARRIISEASTRWSPQYAAENLIGAALTEIGMMWEEGKVALSQIYMSGRICEELVDAYLPPIAQLAQNQPRIAIAVLDDYHLLGKRIVYSVLRASGVSLADYGRLTVDEILARVTHEDIDILLVSVLMLPSALRVKDLKSGLSLKHPGTKIVVGGAPFRFDDQLWKEVGADSFGWNASDAINIINETRG